MSLDLVNNLFNNLKENNFVQNFIKELSNYLEKNLINSSKFSDNNKNWNNLLDDNLQIGNKKIISKYKNEMLLERANILQKYASETENKGEMYYVYDANAVEDNAYNLCICNSSKSHNVITKKIDDLPENTHLGSVLRKKDEEFVLDKEDTEFIENEINNMLKEKIEEQDQYLDSKRIDGHIYEADEKHEGRIWLYDLSDKGDSGIEGIEEIEFPKDLYEAAKKGNKFIYKNGEYQKYD